MHLLPTTPPPRQAARPATPEGEELAPRGCGWFDSSHELHRGLCVSVHDASDELATLVPLRWWLQWELEGALPASR